MKTITIEVPDEMTSLCGGTDENVAGAMRLATAIVWYQQGHCLRTAERIELDALQGAHLPRRPAEARFLSRVVPH